MRCRRITAAELPQLLRLYAFLHPEDPAVDPNGDAVQRVWRQIAADQNLRYFGAEFERVIIATCTLALIPNLTRGLRPYGLIENVVTDPEFRKRGFATAVLRFALEDAWASGCYKVMLETGSKKEETLRFYEKAGFQRGVKTSVIATGPIVNSLFCRGRRWLSAPKHPAPQVRSLLKGAESGYSVSHVGRF
jgi:GNAT superfamily N-acetyltransferase